MGVDSERVKVKIETGGDDFEDGSGSENGDERYLSIYQSNYLSINLTNYGFRLNQQRNKFGTYITKHLHLTSGGNT